MARIPANGIEIEYESFGEGEETLLLIMGLGAQMIIWDEAFCEALAERGLRVIRFDNRDVGRSTHLDALGVPNAVQLFTDLAAGKPISSPYSLGDMADDTAGLLDALGIEAAHVCGVSMGGMIAQTLAVRHPSRVKSLISVMSSTGDPKLPRGKPEVMALLVQRPPEDRNGYVDYATSMWRAIGSPGFEFDETGVRARSARHYDRSFDPGGVGRQLAAIVADGDRTAALAKVSAPDARHPRRRRSPRPAGVRCGDPGGDSRSEAVARPRNGPRPAAGCLAPTRRRHRGSRDSSVLVPAPPRTPSIPRWRSAERSLFRQLNRILEPGLRRGLGSACSLAPWRVVVLETRGRATGRLHRTPLAALVLGRHAVVATLRGTRAHWVANLERDVRPTVWMAGRPRDVRAWVFPAGEREDPSSPVPAWFQPALPLLAPYRDMGWAFALLSTRAAAMR